MIFCQSLYKPQGTKIFSSDPFLDFCILNEHFLGFWAFTQVPKRSSSFWTISCSEFRNRNESKITFFSMFDRFVKTVAAALMTSNFDKSASFFVRFKKQKVLPTFQKLICKEKKFCVIEPLQSEIRTRYDSLRSLITEPKSAIIEVSYS